MNNQPNVDEYNRLLREGPRGTEHVEVHPTNPDLLIYYKGHLRCFVNTKTGERSYSSANRERLHNGWWLLTDKDGSYRLINFGTGQESSRFRCRRVVVEDGKIYCYSLYNTRALFDEKTAQFGPFQKVV